MVSDNLNRDLKGLSGNVVVVMVFYEEEVRKGKLTYSKGRPYFVVGNQSISLDFFRGRTDNPVYDGHVVVFVNKNANERFDSEEEFD